MRCSGRCWNREPPTIPVIDVVASPDEEAHTRAVIADANTVRENSQLPPLQWVDLRGALSDARAAGEQTLQVDPGDVFGLAL
jgi:hypothetical protein